MYSEAPCFCICAVLTTDALIYIICLIDRHTVWELCYIEEVLHV